MEIHRHLVVTCCIGLFSALPLLAADTSVSATYLGGCGGDDVRAVVVNELAGHPFEGDVYVAGRTTSSDLGEPCELTEGDVFVARFDHALATLHRLRILRSPSGSEQPIALAMMPQGHPMSGWIVLLGETDNATDIPDDHDFGVGGRDDAFLAALDPELELLLAGHLGGAIHDRPSALAIHPVSGDIYVAGETNSADFPGTDGGAQAENAGIFDAFVSRLTLSISLEPPVVPELVLVQSTFLGGRSGSEVEVGLALSDESEEADVYIKGRTNSIDLPVTANAPQSKLGGGIEDLFVARFSSELTEALAVTYLGGNGIEETRDSSLVLHSETREVYVAGTTRSEGTDPLTKIMWQRGGFIAQFSPSLARIETVAMVPVSGVDDLLQHPSGDLYLLGTVFTGSFPTGLTDDAAQPDYGGGSGDAFVARYDGELTPLRATYFGGNGSEGFLSFGVHPMLEEIYVAGNTQSTDLPFAAGAIQSSNAGSQDGFVARFAADLSNTGVAQATYLGGSKNEILWALATPDLESLYVAGSTASDDLDTGDDSPQPTPGGGGTDGFVARLGLDLTAPLPPCVGDCDGDGSVRVNELIVGVNINLQLRTVGDCPVFDVDGNGGVQVNELIQAVNSNLRGCKS